MHVETVEGFSAHADWQAVLRWLGGLKTTPKKVFTTHGEPEAAEAMAQHIAINSAGTSKCRGMRDCRTLVSVCSLSRA